MTIAGKRFPTFTTLIRFFSSVNSLVLSDGTALIEGLPALMTLIQPFSSVAFVSLNEFGPQDELPTITTLIWLFCSVNSPMTNEVKDFSKSFPTFVTLTIHFSGADTLMLNNFLVVAGSFFTFTPLVMTSSTEKFLWNLTTTVWLLSGKSGLELENV
uniref:Uncharacterized protein n=1 Tax=Myotis myotis TaxID=51298 RepID=A0A7J7R242_MYOMY|nr:hypothetical protein mMyoMyo1_011206 [Myotis myotis]